MVRVLALTEAHWRAVQEEFARRTIVLGCALALIAAGNALPF